MQFGRCIELKYRVEYYPLQGEKSIKIKVFDGVGAVCGREQATPQDADGICRWPNPDRSRDRPFHGLDGKEKEEDGEDREEAHRNR